MAFLLDVTFQDVNQLESKSSMWVTSEEVVSDVLDALKAASNAKIIKASLSTPVPLTTITGNDATGSNVETVTQKAIITMRGADAGSSGEPFARARIGIPAPSAPISGWGEGFSLGDEVSSLVSKVLSKTGVQMDVVESIKYSR